MRLRVGAEGFTWLIGLAAVMPLLWHWSTSRRWASATVLAYYVAGSRGLPFGAGILNDWWARDTSIPVIPGQAMDAWGLLFGLPVVRATNI